MLQSYTKSILKEFPYPVDGVDIMASKGNTFENGSTKMSVSGVVNADKIAIVEKLIIKYK